jgi:hypothetical protein
LNIGIIIDTIPEIRTWPFFISISGYIVISGALGRNRVNLNDA